MDLSPLAPAALRPAVAPETLIDVSVLVPVYDEEGSVAELAVRVGGRDRQPGGPLRDRLRRRRLAATAPPTRVRAARERDPRVKLVRLRRNFGKAAALTAGFEHCRGRLVITMDGDLQDDPDEIPRFVERTRGRRLRPGLGLEARASRPARQDAALAPVQLGDAAPGRRSQLHDFNCGFKAYRREVLEQVADLRRASPLHPGARQPPRLPRWGRSRSRHHPRRTASRSTAGIASTRACST